jgi:hypothetical protein
MNFRMGYGYSLDIPDPRVEVMERCAPHDSVWAILWPSCKRLAIIRPLNHASGNLKGLWSTMGLLVMFRTRGRHV